MIINGKLFEKETPVNFIQARGTVDDDKCGFCDREDENGTCIWTGDGNGQLILGYDLKNKCMLVRLSGTASGVVGLPIKYCPWCGRKIEVENGED